MQTRHLVDDDVLRRLAAVPGDRLVVEPISRTREVLAPEVRRSSGRHAVGGAPDCDLREAERAGDVQFGASDTFEASGDVPVTQCYEGAVVRYTDAGRTVTVVGSADFMSNAGLLKQGNAALAMNLAGTQQRVIWYAPQHTEGESSGAASLSDLIPDNVTWMVCQLCLVVLLLAVWKGRRLGPLVAERLPVVVRASETVEGRGRLYRSQRAGDRAADALRTATLQRLRLASGSGPTPTAPPSSRPSRSDADETQARGAHAFRAAASDRHRPGKPCPRSTTSKGRSHSRDSAHGTPAHGQTAGAASAAIDRRATRCWPCGTRSPRWSSVRTPSSAAW